MTTRNSSHLAIRAAVLPELATCASAVPIPVGSGAAPDWVMIMPPGEFRGVDGRGPWKLTDPQAVIAASSAVNGGQGFCVDYNHQSVFAVSNGGEAPAAGWVDQLELREGAIWAHVDWTGDGANAVAARHYRFVSPTFKFDPATGAVQQIVSVGLVNNPNLVELPAINSQIAPTGQGASMEEFLAALRQALGLAADAGQDAVLTACRSSVATCAALSASVPDPAKFVPMAAFAELQTHVKSLSESATRRNATEAVNAAMLAGKVTPALKDWAMGFASSNPDGFTAWCAAAPSIVKPGGIGLTGEAPGALAIPDEASKAVCAALGIDPAKFATAAAQPIPVTETRP